MRLHSALFTIVLSIISASYGWDFAAIDSLLSDSTGNITSLNAPGFTVTVVKDDDVVYNRDFGQNFTDSTRTPIASATKWFSAAVIMSLVDEGLLSLDDQVSEYIPTFTGTKGTIAIRQLMSHTSGLPGNSRYHNDKTLTLQQAADSIGLNVPLKADPGTAFAYGGTSMQVAGRIAEIITGTPWDTIWTERIAQKVGMQSTDYNGLGETDNPQIAGGAQTTARDYILFLRMLMNNGASDNGQVLSSSAVATMLSDQTGGVEIQGTPYSAFEDLQPGISRRRYGIGNWLERLDVSTANPVAFGSQGAFGFSPWYDKEHNVVGVMACRKTLGSVMPTYLAMRDMLRQIWGGTTRTRIQVRQYTPASRLPQSQLVLSKSHRGSYGPAGIVIRRGGSYLDVLGRQVPLLRWKDLP